MVLFNLCKQMSLLQLHGPMICKAMQWFVCFKIQLYMHLHAKNVRNRFGHGWIISIISIISHISNYITHFQLYWPNFKISNYITHFQLYQPIISNYISDSNFEIQFGNQIISNYILTIQLNQLYPIIFHISNYIKHFQLYRPIISNYFQLFTIISLIRNSIISQLYPIYINDIIAI